LTDTRIVTSTYRYKRPARRRQVALSEGPAIMGKCAPTAQGSGVQKQHRPETEQGAPKPAPANDDRKSAIDTARRPGARSSVEVPDMTREEHQRRGDAADALFREMMRRATGKP